MVLILAAKVPCKSSRHPLLKYLLLVYGKKKKKKSSCLLVQILDLLDLDLVIQMLFTGKSATY